MDGDIALKKGDFVLLKPYKDVVDHLGIGETEWNHLRDKYPVMKIYRPNNYSREPAFYVEENQFYWPAAALIPIDPSNLVQYDIEEYGML